MGMFDPSRDGENPEREGPAIESGQFELIERPESGRFELMAATQLVSFADYTPDGHRVVVPHVETLLPFRGQGFAAQLMAHLLPRLRETGRTIVPLCTFAASYMNQHPDQHDLLA